MLSVAMQLSEIQELHARCDPDEPLLAHDNERYVEIDVLAQVDDTDDVGRPRCHAWIERIAKKFEFSRKPRHLLLTGLPGSGKTTELLRVAQRLARADGARLLPVYIDAEKVIDLDQPIDMPDLVLVIMAETERAVLELEGMQNASKDLAHEGVFARLVSYARNTTIEVDKVEAGFDPFKVVAALKTDPTLREQIRASVNTRTSEFLERARAHMRTLEARVKNYEIRGQHEHKYAGIFVLFDSLEKLRGLTTNFREVLERGEHLLRHNADLLNLGVHALYTVPIAISRRIQGVELMPLIKVRERSGASFAPGVVALRSLATKRLSERALVEVFGPQHEHRVLQLIERSGGYPREFVTLLQDSLEEGPFPLSDAAFRRLLAARADEYARKVTTEALPLLAEVARNRGCFIVPDEQRELAESLLTDSLVFVYQNEIEWADINPALASMLPESP